MKHIFKIHILIALALSIGIVSCKEDDEPVGEPQLEVNYKNVSGIWQLIEWNSEEIPEDLHFYLKLNRLDNTFETYDNLGSMYSVKKTGEYEIVGDKYEGYSLTGVYDYTHKDWDEYKIKSLTQSSITLVKKNNANDISIYRKVESIPEYVLE